jgi:hypothetical protein
MSFQAYLEDIQAKTGKATQITDRFELRRNSNLLKADFDLGHGRAMAIVAPPKGKAG